VQPYLDSRKAKQREEEEEMDVAIIVGIAFAGFVISCMRSWYKLKAIEETMQPRGTVKEQSRTEHHAAA